jgi:hypothetical protein
VKLSEIIAKETTRDAGKWVSFDEFYSGVRLKIRPIDNPDVRRMNFEAAGQASAKRDFALAEAQNARLLAEAIVADWSGIEDDVGQPLPFSKATALEWLSVPVLQKLREKIVVESIAIRDASAAALEDDAKN